MWTSRTYGDDGSQLMALHVEFGQRLADQATGALFYALNVRKP